MNTCIPRRSPFCWQKKLSQATVSETCFTQNKGGKKGRSPMHVLIEHGGVWWFQKRNRLFCARLHILDVDVLVCFVQFLRNVNFQNSIFKKCLASVVSAGRRE